jgi:flagella basal body P-ring formation protein FlgA
MKHLLYQTSVILLLVYLQNSEAAQFQTISSIQSAISHFITNEFKAANEYDYTLSQLDHRLNLPLCPKPLHIFTRTGSLKAGRNSIGVRCTSGKKWTIYTSAQIKSYRKVLVLTQAIRRGEIITEKHLSYKNRDIGDLHRGYILDTKLVINKQAKRNLSAGIVITGNHFIEPKLIKRGEKINIHATSTRFHISMAGIALMDGTKGQNIRVKNINSKRIIQATVVRPGQVSVYQ